jgi:pimeloyl-ACP methyl ester carboxylesterase
MFWGSDNKILRIGGGRSIAGRLKPFRFEILAGAGHLVMHESSEEVNRIMDEFLIS